MAFRRSAAGLVAAAVLATASPATQAAKTGGNVTQSQPPADPAPWATLCANRDAWLTELARWPAICLQREDTGHTIFHGCIDWHSAVHGHWAVLRSAAMLGPNAQSDDVVARLTAEGVASEAAALAERPAFELPYGRAWFLRLALEHHALTGTDLLQEMADAQSAALRERFTTRPPTAISREYQNASWALTQLHAWMTHRGDDDGLAWLRKTVQTHLTQVDPVIGPEMDHDAWPEFFSRWGNQALVLQTVLGPEATRAWLRGQTIPPDALKVVVNPNGAHHLSMNFSRAWAFWALYQATDEPQWRDAYARHIAAGMAAHPTHRDRYGAYGHWVPQFGIYALTAPMGATSDPTPGCPAE